MENIIKRAEKIGEKMLNINQEAIIDFLIGEKSNNKYKKKLEEQRQKIEERYQILKEKAEGDPNILREATQRLQTQIQDELNKKVKNVPEKDKKEKKNLYAHEICSKYLVEAYAILKTTANIFNGRDINNNIQKKEIKVIATEKDKELIKNNKKMVRIETDDNGKEYATYQNTWEKDNKEYIRDMTHFDNQIKAGIALHEGNILELGTGEGKTLVATLPAFLNGLTGLNVHIVNINEYLANRDYERTGPIYNFLGLSVDCLENHKPKSSERKKAYEADILFGTAQQFCFDNIRNNVVQKIEEKTRKKANFAIIDEADSVLIDAASTPMIISQEFREDSERYKKIEKDFKGEKKSIKEDIWKEGEKIIDSLKKAIEEAKENNDENEKWVYYKNIIQTTEGIETKELDMNKGEKYIKTFLEKIYNTAKIYIQQNKEKLGFSRLQFCILSAIQLGQKDFIKKCIENFKNTDIIIDILHTIRIIDPTYTVDNRYIYDYIGFIKNRSSIKGSEIEKRHGISRGTDMIIQKHKEIVNWFFEKAKKKLKDENIEEEEKKQAEMYIFIAYKGDPKNEKIQRFLKNEKNTGLIEKREELYQVNRETINNILENKLYFIIDEKSEQCRITNKGICELENFCPNLSETIKKLYTENEDGEKIHLFNQFIKANFLYTKGKEYIVENGKVILIDKITGRQKKNTKYNELFHQSIETKEGVEISPIQSTIGKSSLQKYFRKYYKVAGMTGTAMSDKKELETIYNIGVCHIDPNKPAKRKDLDDKFFETKKEKYNAIVERIREIHKSGRPILLIATSINEANEISEICKNMNIEHQKLTAETAEKQEAEIISNAGKKNVVTIATNVAGRGTDIKLETGINEIGGLAVIGVSHNESERVDNQSRGRAGRQGDNGSSEFFVCMEDDIIKEASSRLCEKMIDEIQMKQESEIEEIFGDKKPEELNKNEIEKINKIIEKYKEIEIEKTKEIKNKEKTRITQEKNISKTIKEIQKQIQENNFAKRKNMIEYTEVIEKLQNIFVEYRYEILEKPKDFLEKIIKYSEKRGGETDKNDISISEKIEKFLDSKENEKTKEWMLLLLDKGRAMFLEKIEYNEKNMIKIQKIIKNLGNRPNKIIEFREIAIEIFEETFNDTFNIINDKMTEIYQNNRTKKIEQKM